MEALQGLVRTIRQPWENFKYSRVRSDEYGFDVRKRPAMGPIARIVLAVMGAVFFIAGAYTYLATDSSLTDVTDSRDVVSSADYRYDISSGPKRLVVVVFGSDPGPALCKVMMSAVAMGYPMPVVVNWGQHLPDYFPEYIMNTHKNHVGPHLLKIVGALEYLDEVSHKTAHEDDRLDDEDLVLMVDAYDIWFQTPPEVLIRRYHEQNREARERFLKQWPGRKADMPMDQSIIISAQKKCYPLPGGPYNLQCDKIPESPLRSDLYGPGTDPTPDKLDKPVADYHEVRPKFLNSGAILGPVGALRKYLRKSKERMDDKAVNEDRRLRSDQGMMGEIWGEQEVYRTWLRQNAKTWASKPKDLFMQSRDFEYGVGLDYKQDICIATVFEEHDGDILELSNKTYIDNRSRELGIMPTRLRGVPEDLAKARNPLSILPDVKNMPSWDHMAMYADFFTTSVPAMVHHNAHDGGLKNRNTLWWDRMWYFPYLRDLVNARLSAPELSALGEVTGRDGKPATYWPVKGDKTKRLPRIFRQGKGKDGLDTGKWDDLCFNKEAPDVHWSEEVMRDGKGALRESQISDDKKE